MNDPITGSLMRYLCFTFFFLDLGFETYLGSMPIVDAFPAYICTDP